MKLRINFFRSKIFDFTNRIELWGWTSPVFKLPSTPLNNLTPKITRCIQPAKSFATLKLKSSVDSKTAYCFSTNSPVCPYWPTVLISLCQCWTSGIPVHQCWTSQMQVRQYWTSQVPVCQHWNSTDQCWSVEKVHWPVSETTLISCWASTDSVLT